MVDGLHSISSAPVQQPIPSLESGSAAGVSPVWSQSSLRSTGEPWWSGALLAYVKLAPCLGTADRVASWSLKALDTSCLQIKLPDFQIPCFFFVPYYYFFSTSHLHLLYLLLLLSSFPLLCNKGLFPVRGANGEYARLQRLSEASPAGRGFFPPQWLFHVRCEMNEDTLWNRGGKKKALAPGCNCSFLPRCSYCAKGPRRAAPENSIQ